MRTSLSSAQNKWLTRKVLGLVIPLVRQPEVHQHVLHLQLRLSLAATFQECVEQNVLFHCEAATSKEKNIFCFVFSQIVLSKLEQGWFDADFYWDLCQSQRHLEKIQCFVQVKGVLLHWYFTFKHLPTFLVDSWAFVNNPEIAVLSI